jgi:hypothetical protein
MERRMSKMPKSAAQAKKQRYSVMTVKHSDREKQKWALVKHKRKWAFRPTASALPSGSHIVCYYDPNTGFYDDCHRSD